MSKSEYHDYLRSPEWKETRAQAIAHYGKRCNRCGSRKFIQIHHKHYHSVGRELLTDLEVLCKPCHEEEHGIMPTVKRTKKQRKRRSRNPNWRNPDVGVPYQWEIRAKEDARRAAGRAKRNQMASAKRANQQYARSLG